MVGKSHSLSALGLGMLKHLSDPRFPLLSNGVVLRAGDARRLRWESLEVLGRGCLECGPALWLGAGYNRRFSGPWDLWIRTGHFSRPPGGFRFPLSLRATELEQRSGAFSGKGQSQAAGARRGPQVSCNTQLCSCRENVAGDNADVAAEAVAIKLY